MRWWVIRPVVALLAWALRLLDFTRACLGCLRFFLLSGASPRYILSRKRWFEDTMLGRPMTLREVLQFGSWHAQGASRWGTKIG